MVNLTYDYEWDAHKAASNLKKHGVTFEQAASVFLDALALTVFDAAHSEHEERWFTLGYTTGGVLLAVAHTYQATSLSNTRIRIISARPATKQEQHFYADEPL
ncbi:MAG: BrnT family toxin [Nitrosomonadales bacterium]|nr:BrnT family toxin [Nitrosomonadales bacterium]